MTAVQPVVPSPPLVWAELITEHLDEATAFYGSLFGWRSSALPGSTDLVVHLDVARMAGPICGIRARQPNDPRPAGVPDPAVDRWNVRLSPPRPPAAADPGGDQLLRPRQPGPRLGRWASPNSLCFAELRTPDVEGARRWMEQRLDGIVEPVAAAGSDDRLVLRSSIDPSRAIVALVDEPDPAAAGWLIAIQVPSLGTTLADAERLGATNLLDRPLPSGCPGTAAAELTDPGGARVVLVEHGPIHGRR